MFHEKSGIFQFPWGDRVAFSGSPNETEFGHVRNYERLDAFRSWIAADQDRLEATLEDFDRQWEGRDEAIENIKILDSAAEEIGVITGQKPVITKARKSISNFKLRAGVPIGIKVTLRRDRMYYFLDKLMAVALPRVRDFKGISPKGFDGRGNYTLGIKEQIIFPEVNYDKIDKIKGMNITIVTTARTDEEGMELLRLLGMPFRA